MKEVAKDCKQVTEPSFENVMEAVGSRGKFQTRFNMIFIYLGSAINMMSVHLCYIAMQTPDHWCNVLRRENVSSSTDEWKNFTTPRGQDSFSKCMMYNDSHTHKAANMSAIPCEDGWEYDKTWFSMTASSQMSWICNNRHIVNDIKFYSQYVAAVMGLLFGYIGDMYGRRMQQFLCLSALMSGHVVLLLAPSIPVLLAAGEPMVAAASVTMFGSSLSVGLEMTDVKHRTTISSTACLCAGVGMMAAGLVAWIMPYWNFLLMFDVLCYLALFSFIRCFPESPRWLACRGRKAEALSLMGRIAAANGSGLPPFTRQVVRRVARTRRDGRGLLAVLSSWNLFRTTLVLVIARWVHMVTAVWLVARLRRVSSGPLAWLALQGAAQLPACLALYCCAAHLGRRWSAVTATVLTAVAGSVAILLITGGAPGACITGMSVVMLCSTAAGGAVSSLQVLELQPTCLRQTAPCLQWAVAVVFLSLLPPILFVGGSVHSRLPFAILSALNLLAAFAVSFLPESALQRLPESLADAAVIGKDRQYWSWKPKPQNYIHPINDINVNQEVNLKRKMIHIHNTLGTCN